MKLSLIFLIYRLVWTKVVNREITLDHEADFSIEWKDVATVQRSTFNAQQQGMDSTEGKSKSSTMLDGGVKVPRS